MAHRSLPRHAGTVADLPQRVTWWSSLGVWARGLVRPRVETDVNQGADWSRGTQTIPEYDRETALSTFAAFPWVRACVDAIGTDLAGLPWVASVGEGAQAQTIDAHPVLDLLREPTTWQTGEEWERQLLLYLLLTGDAFAAIVGRTAPTSLPLLHSDRMRIEGAPYGAPERYRYGTGGEDVYEPRDIVHVRLSSWRSNTQALYGEGLARALHDLLTAEQQSQRLTAKAAARGRPEAIIRPKEGIGLWDADVRKAIADAYSAQMRQGGALVLSDALDAEFPAFTPRDLEFADAGVRARETVLAAFGVPPSRVGLPTANYATQQQQMKTYWEGLQGLSRLVCAKLTKALGNRYGGQRVTIRKDFSGVDAMQESRDARLDRVKKWVDLGMSPASAAAYEGFPDAPDLVEEPASAGESVADGVQVDDALPARALTLFRGEAPPEAPALHIVDRLDVPRDEEGRAGLWRGYLDTLHTPTERALTRAVEDDFARQRDSIVERMGSAPWPQRMARDVVMTRDLTSEVMAWLFPSTDPTAIPEDIRAILDGAIRAAFRSGARYIGERYDYSPSMLDATVQSSIGSWVRVATTTQDAVQAIVDRGIREGATVYDMQRLLKDLPAFTPTRARVVARTETTRAVNGGAQDSYATALLNGVDLRKEWLSARDLDVRFEHMELDGQQKHTGELFTVPSGPFAGAQARYPGDFVQAALVVNCRCTTIPVVMGAR
jgi:HK97 family phage portal protein